MEAPKATVESGIMRTGFSEMRILTFNWHEAYICLLAKTGHQWHIIERLKGGVKHWLYQVRPLPSNATLVDEQTAMEKLNRGGYDLVICHNVKDLMQVQTSSVPKIMVFHNKLSTEIALGGNQVNRDKYLNDLRNLLDNIPHLHLVFVSESKRADWGLPGQVITPGIELDEYRSYEGTEPKVLRVGNFIKERDIMMGFSAQEQILFGIPSTLLGLNPTLPGAKISNSWEDLKQHYRSHRVYLNTTVEGWEDGYNLAMLEAMATGMPVVSTANSTSPVVDGHNGYISDDLKYLREKILYLLEDREEAVRLGKNARKTVEERFNINDFVAKWREVMEGAAVIPASRWGGRPYVRGTTTGNGGKNILLAYVSYPATTARYLEDSLRKTHNVVTVGPSIWPGLIKKWNLENMGEEVKPHDIPCGFDIDIRQVVEELSPAWQPDLLLWVESVYGYLPKGIGQLPFPTACYLIDSHLHLREHLKWVEGFNFIFVAQRQYIPEFERAGFKNVYWLPLACDPQVHRKFDVKKVYEIGFAGSLTPEHRERRRLLTLLCQQFNVHIDRKFFREMALLFSRSKIVFNHSVRNDLNMRVFEALCCGSMLLTDEARGGGLNELFRDREHLVIYRNQQELVELARYYLEHPEEREEIARKGREEALAKHTFDHRVEQMMNIVFPLGNRLNYKSTGPKDAGQDNGGRIQICVSKPKDYYERERQEIVELIPPGVARVLDVGCAAGYLGRRLKKLGVREVVGVEINPEVAKQAEQYLDQVIVGDIEQLSLPFSPRSFDCIICADILEHLRNPGRILNRLREYLSDKGVLIASLPNVRYLGVINHLVEGNWTYQDSGILDETHLRFFTRKEIIKLLRSSGYEIETVAANVSPEYEKIKGYKDNALSFGRITIRNLGLEELKDLFVFQYLIRARKRGNGQEKDGELISDRVVERKLN
ncbi:MAG TPA: methyltransferase domain-containing protein [Firmicutes bacterium]|nr:methyltransferase domain-containing protein [Bacillota bacterium]